MCYHLTRPNFNFLEAVFALKTKLIEKNKHNNRVINPKGGTNLDRLCPKNLPILPKASFGISKLKIYETLLNWVQELFPFSFIYKLERTPKDKTTFAKIDRGHYLSFQN